jgi:uncharacterized membrane protein YhiD involved in acid resistance
VISIPEIAVRLALAGLIGLAVGIEREWSGHASGPSARFAGVRTFFLLGLVGGIAGWLYTVPATAIAVVLLATGRGLTVVAYAVDVRDPQFRRHHGGGRAAGARHGSARAA